ncbi:MAG: DNA translocase FtsK [Hyphomicrobiaceae bacterium]
MPARLTVSLRAGLVRLGGLALLVASVALWAALISWSADDPVLAHVAGVPSRNLMGAAGANLADFLLQILGLGGATLLFLPTFAGIRLLAGRRQAASRLRLAVWPLSAILAAAAFSSLPVLGGWPFANGLGGIVGDLVYGLVRQPLVAVVPGIAGALSGLLLSALAVMSVSASLDLPVPGLGRWTLGRSALAVRQPRSGHRDPADTAPIHAQRHGPAGGPHDLAFSSDAAPGIARRFAHDGFDALPPLSREEPPFDDTETAQPPFVAPLATPSFAGRDARATRSGQIHPGSGFGPQRLDDDPLGEEDDDEDDDFGVLPHDEESAQMAARFAPKSPAGTRGPGTVSATPAPIAEAVGTPGEAHLAVPTEAAAAFLADAYRLPPLRLLKQPAAARPSPEFAGTVLRGNARLLEDVLAEFGIRGRILDQHPGPVVTVYELEPGRGVRTERVVGLAIDIARAMSVNAARIAPIPGRQTLGLELPNVRRETILLREVLESEAWRRTAAALPLALGKTVDGEPVVADLTRMPHLVLAGAAGSGRASGLRAMILSLLYRLTPEDLRLVVIDPRRLEPSPLEGLPHLLTPVVTDARHAVAVLEWIVREMDERYKQMSRLNIRNIETYNNVVQNAHRQGTPLTRRVQTGYDRRTGQPIHEIEELRPERMPHIVVLVEELSELMQIAGHATETAIHELGQRARAVGIHLIAATGRPAGDVLTSVIRSSIPTRIAFRLASRQESRLAIDTEGAEQLLGAGDMLYNVGGQQILRLHAPYASAEELAQVAADLRRQGPARYLPELAEAAPSARTLPSARTGEAIEDPLYDRAVAMAVRDRGLTAGLIERRLGVTRSEAASLARRLAADGLIGHTP